jgi:cytochrome d ubiquinol oxidase subunit I
MDDLLYARSLMGLSLAFHIVFAAIGVAMPLLMALAEWRWRRTGDGVFLDLARRWAKGTAILFAVGAVSGTVISFELGLLWPRFMQFAGALIGMPFSLEGFAFFTEAIFLGIYLYGWDKVSPRLHLASAFIVAASGAASAFFVTLANAWMNVPAGFELANGIPTKIDPLVAMFPPGWAREVIHVLLSSYVAPAFMVAAIHARALLRTPSSRFHRAALGISLSVAAATAVLQVVSGDASARGVAMNQPLKLAALEGQFQTESGAPLRIGGLPDEESRRTSSAIEIPHGLSLLAFHEWNAKVKGLDDFPRRDWPRVVYVHVAFQIMVACGSLLAMLSLIAAALGLRGHGLPLQRWFLWAVTLAGPLGFVALEAGWMVTELGRQPYVAHGVLRTSDAVTAVRGLALPFWAFTALYLFLSVAVAALLRRQLAAPVEERA